MSARPNGSHPVMELDPKGTSCEGWFGHRIRIFTKRERLRAPKIRQDRLDTAAILSPADRTKCCDRRRPRNDELRESRRLIVVFPFPEPRPLGAVKNWGLYRVPTG